MHVLVTGATGFIGGKVTEHFIRKGENVHLFVRNAEKLPKYVKECCRITIGDVTCSETLTNAVKGVDALIHCAGLLGHWGVSLRQLYAVNVEGSINVVNSAYHAGIKRMVHLSAGGVTGPVGSNPADETFQPAPMTAYERTKWKGEQEILKLARERDQNLLVLRPTFTYGPCDPHKLNLFRAIKANRFVFIGNGNSTVHPVYIDDLVRGIDLGLASDLKQKSIIIGGAQPVTKEELVYGIADALGVSRPAFRLPARAAEIAASICEVSASVLKFNPPITRSRVWALSRNWGYSIDFARRKLGYEPHVDLREGLSQTIAWYRENGWL